MLLLHHAVKHHTKSMSYLFNLMLYMSKNDVCTLKEGDRLEAILQSIAIKSFIENTSLPILQAILDIT